MIVAFSGPRDLFVTQDVLEGIIKSSGFEITRVLAGDANGIDRCVRLYFKEHAGMMWNLNPRSYVADWKTYGKAAGPKRNEEMLKDAEAFIAIRDSRRTRGTGHAVKHAVIDLNLPHYVEQVPAHQLVTGQFVAVTREEGDDVL